LVPVENIDLETLSLSLNPKFASIVEQSRRSQEEAGQIFLEDISLPSDP
jgi:hypothetical protein